MSIEGQGHFFTIYFPGFVCFMLYLDKISGERLQDHWSSGFIFKFNALFLSILKATENKLILRKYVKRCPILLISFNLAFHSPLGQFLMGGKLIPIAHWDPLNTKKVLKR